MDILNGFKMGEGGAGIFSYNFFSLCSIFVAQYFPHTDLSSQNSFLIHSFLNFCKCSPMFQIDLATQSVFAASILF